MAGTKAGGQAAAVTNKKKYGPNFYKKIGRKGGSISRGGGFSGEAGRILARAAGRKGGSISRRGRSTGDYDSYCTYCGSEGHYKRFCAIYNRDKAEGHIRITKVASV